MTGRPTGATTLYRSGQVGVLGLTKQRVQRRERKCHELVIL